MSARKPWERMPGETAKSYAHFMRYRDMDRLVRGIRPLARELGRDTKQLFKWSTQFDWAARVRAWDEYLDEQSRVAQIETIKKAGSVRALTVLAGLELIHDRLVGRDRVVDQETGVIVREQVLPIEPNLLDAKDLSQLGGMLSKMHSLAEESAGLKRGDADRPIDIRLSFDLDNLPLSDAEKKTIIQAKPRELLPAADEPGP